MSVLAFSVSHRGNAVQFSVDDTLTLGDLRRRLEQQFGVAPQQQRLLLKGEIGASSAGDSAPIASLIPANSRIVLIGTPATELAEHLKSSERREEGRANYDKYRATTVFRTRDPTGHSEYGFLRFETLPGLPCQASALAMLQRLARDEGVRGIMQKRQYSVGVLRELHPNERTILGYNRNRGQVIALRLRTDDLEGFRDYTDVRKVLMHELAHMVWDEHDERFHRLNRELCQELDELDWTRRGQTVGGGAPSAGPRFQQTTVEDSAVDGGALTSKGFVLGGTAPQLPPGDSAVRQENRRELAFQAWQKRKK
ncbi:hypothetical protein IWW37_004263 [Coemansia sp. RSA 2050]|nr:hypothetical protein IWW37_004263 [Coemansia sp. RSA 2050]KAJ2731586.1 hypothetical protein IW152_004454 [Coemansia sp. BCRC 34962]